MQSENNYKANQIEMQELLEDVNNVIKTGVNKIVYDILFKKLNDELNKCKAEIVQLKKTYGKCDIKENIELKIEDDSETTVVNTIDRTPIKIEPKYSEILKVINKMQNSQINKNKPKLVIIDDNDNQNNETTKTQDLECENCDLKINPNREGYHILEKESDEKVLCNECFTDLKVKFLKEGWVCDEESDKQTDTSESEESESEKEESVAEEEEEVEEEEVEEEEVEEEEVEEEEEAEEEEEEEEEVEEEVEEEEVEEEEEEEEVEVEEEEVEKEEVEKEEDEEEAEDEEEEEEVFEIEIDDVTYFATSEENGPLYDVDEEGNPGNKVGYLKDCEPFFY